MEKLADALTVPEAAEALRLRPQTLRMWRSAGKGPTSIRIGGRVLYPRAELDKWISQQYVEAKGDALAK